MNGHGPQPPRRDAEESMDAAARRLREEMETALRHLRAQALSWGTAREDERGDPSAPGRSPTVEE